MLFGLICNLLNIFCFVSSFKKCFLQLKGFKAPPGPGRGGVRGQTCTKTFLGQVGMCLQNFIKVSVLVWISISPPHTNRQRNVHLYAHLYIDRDYPVKMLGVGPQTHVRIQTRVTLVCGRGKWDRVILQTTFIYRLNLIDKERGFNFGLSFKDLLDNLKF